MKLYARNNIVATRGNDLFYISEVGDEYLHLLNREQDNYTLIEKADIYLKDIEMSDWVLDALFKKHFYYECEELYYWDLGTGKYSIEKVDEDLYKLMIGSNILIYFDTIRELQNAYHFYSDYDHEENVLTDDIDTKLKKLFKLI